MPSLLVREYYDVLSAFLHLAPDLSRGLTKFERLEAERDDRRCLDQMINLMESIGCEAFIVESHAILNAYENSGNWRLAGTHARRMRGDFNEFCGRVENARKKADPTDRLKPLRPVQDGAEQGEVDPADFDPANFEPLEEEQSGAGESLTLADAIRLIDEKATEGKKIILAVDDSPAILQSVWAILHDAYQVLVLAKPEDIEKVLEKQTPDMFLLDYKMPGLSGFELIPIIRNFEEHKDTPIIFLTSDGSVDNVTSALALGAMDFIVKPFKPAILREKIDRHIKK